MSDQIISRDSIKAQARRAAESGKGPESCPYMPGSIYEEKWKDAYYIRMSQLMGGVTFGREAA